MKFLCVCQYGHCRSVCLARALHGYGHHAVAIGYATSSDALSLLSTWADHIFVLQEGIAALIPREFRSKVGVFDVGPDRWMNPFNAELREILTTKVDEFFAKHSIDKKAKV